MPKDADWRNRLTSSRVYQTSFGRSMRLETTKSMEGQPRSPRRRREWETLRNKLGKGRKPDYEKDHDSRVKPDRRAPPPHAIDLNQIDFPGLGNGHFSTGTFFSGEYISADKPSRECWRKKGALEWGATGAGKQSLEDQSGRSFLHVTHGKSSFGKP